jgi:hypothetical protein
MIDIFTQPTFTREEEVELHSRMVAGDTEAKELLARSVYNWAFKVALKFGRHKIDREEISCLAGLAIAEALNRLDPAKGRLTTLVYFQVRKEITRYIKTMVGALRVPVSADASQKHWNEAENGRKRAVSLFAPVAVDSRDTIASLIPGRCSDPQETAAEREELSVMRRRYFFALAAMPESRVKVVLIRRHRGDTYPAIAKSMGFCKQRAQQLFKVGNRQFMELIERQGAI